MYDLIGDIHGNADELVHLLDSLGYRQSSGVDPKRTLAFVIADEWLLDLNLSLMHRIPKTIPGESMAAVFSKRLEGRTRSIEELVGLEQWQIEYRDAQFAWDVQDLISECIDHQNLLSQQFQDTLQRIIDGDVKDVHLVSSWLLGQFDRGLAAFRAAERLLDTAHSRKHAIDCERVFRRGFLETKKLRRRIKSRWPLRNKESVRLSLSQAKDGKCKSVKEIIHGLCGSNPQ